MYTSRVILKILGVEDYGTYNVVGGVVIMLSFLNTSMAATYQRYFNYEMGKNNENGVRKTFQSSLTVQLFYATLIILVAETLGLWFVENILVISPDRINAALWVYHLSILSFALTVFQSPFNALIISYEKMGIFAYISIIDSLLKLVLVIALPFFDGDKMILYGWLNLGIVLINTVIYISICKIKFTTCKLVPSFNKNNFRNLLGFGAWSMLDSLSYTLINQGINIVLNIFFGAIINAARGIAYQILNAVNQFISSFQTSFRPQLTKSYAEGDLTYMYSLYYTATKISCYLIWCISLPIIIETPTILWLWLGDNVPEYTVIFTRLIMLTALVNVYANPTSCIAFATGKIKWFTIIVSGINLLNLPIAYIFLKLGYGPTSAMFVGFFMSILVQAIRLLVVKKLLPFSLRNYFIQVIFPTISVIFISPIIPLILKKILYFNVFSSISICVCSIICVFSIALLLGFNKNEKKIIYFKIQHLIRKNKLLYKNENYTE